MTTEHPEVDPFQPRAYLRPAERIDAMQLLDNSTDAGGALPTNSASVTAIAGWMSAYGFRDFKVIAMSEVLGPQDGLDDLFGLELGMEGVGGVAVAPGDYVIRTKSGVWGVHRGALGVEYELLGDAKRYGRRQVVPINEDPGPIREEMSNQLQLDSGCARREIIWRDAIFLDANRHPVDEADAVQVSLQCEVEVEVVP